MKKILVISFLLFAAITFAQPGKTIQKSNPTPVVEQKKATTTKEKPTNKSMPSGTVILTVEAQMVNCTNNPDKQCFKVLRNGEYAYETVEDIESFPYEFGYTYTIQVKEILKTPPIGANESMYRYKWIKTLNKKEDGATEETETPTNPKKGTTNTTILTNENGKKIGKSELSVESVLDKKWYLRKLKDVDGTSLVTDDNVMFMTISTFNDRMEGFGACNKFAAVMRSDLSTSFDVSKLSYDLSNCGYKKIENLFFELLQTTNKFEVRNGNLILSNQWNFLLAFTSDPNNKEDISTTYTPQNIYKNEDKTYASSEKQNIPNKESFTPTPIKESTSTTVETKTVTTLDENKQPVTTTNTTVTSNEDDEIQKQIDELKKKQEAKKAALQKADDDAKIATDKEAELKKKEELKQQELAAAKAKEEKLAKLKAEQERLQKELAELDNGTTGEQKPTTTTKPTTITEKNKTANSDKPTESTKVAVVEDKKQTTKKVEPSINITNNTPNTVIQPNITTSTIDNSMTNDNSIYPNPKAKDAVYYNTNDQKLLFTEVTNGTFTGNDKNTYLEINERESKIQFPKNKMPKLVIKTDGMIPNSDYITLYTCDFKKDKRQIFVRPQRNRVLTSYSEIAPNVYEIVLPENISEGEYVFVKQSNLNNFSNIIFNTTKIEVYCFGVIYK